MQARRLQTNKSFSGASDLSSGFRVQGSRLQNSKKAALHHNHSFHNHRTNRRRQFDSYADLNHQGADMLQQCLQNLQTRNFSSNPVEHQAQYDQSKTAEIVQELKDLNVLNDANSSADKTTDETTSENTDISLEVDHSLTVDEHRKEKTGMIMIHVCDEARNLTKDFYCEKGMLLKGMSYFKDYLTGDDENDPYDCDVDISVHCDLKIFEWLMDYVKKPDYDKPPLSTKHLVSILISSQFLAMDELTEKCLRFFKNHANEIVKLPIDLSCINDELVDILSELFSTDDIDALVDPKDKLSSRLYRRKVDDLLNSSKNPIYQCIHCSELFSADQWSEIECTEGKPFVTYHGKILTRHRPSKNWNISKYILTLRLHGYRWSSIYWQLWALTRPVFYCIICKSAFAIQKLNHCHYHIKTPEFLNSSNRGVFKCCDQDACRFHITDSERCQIIGCKSMPHTLDDRQRDTHALTLEQAEKHEEQIYIPFKQNKKKKQRERPMSANCLTRECHSKTEPKKKILEICSPELYELGVITDLAGTRSSTELSKPKKTSFTELSEPQIFVAVNRNQKRDDNCIEWIDVESEENDSENELCDGFECEDIEEDEEGLDPFAFMSSPMYDSHANDSKSVRNRKGKSKLNDIKASLRKISNRPRFPLKYGRKTVKRSKSRKRIGSDSIPCYSPSKKREFKLDAVRKSDREKMENLLKSLGNVRSKAPENGQPRG